MAQSMYRIENQEDITIVILTLEGFTHEDNDELMKAFDDLLNKGSKKIVLDLSETRYVSSLILASLVYMQKKVQETGGALVFCSIPERVNEILSMTNLDKIFNITPDRPQALEKVQKHK